MSSICRERGSLASSLRATNLKIAFDKIECDNARNHRRKERGPENDERDV
jgi:hypothetical protein